MAVASGQVGMTIGKRSPYLAVEQPKTTTSWGRHEDPLVRARKAKLKGK